MITAEEFFEKYFQQKAALFDLMANHLFTQFVVINPTVKKSDEPLHDVKVVKLPKSWVDDINLFLEKFSYKDFVINGEPLRPDYTDSSWLLKVGRICTYHAEAYRGFAGHVDFELVMKMDDASSRLLGICHALVAYLAAAGDEEADLFFRPSSLSH